MLIVRSVYMSNLYLRALISRIDRVAKDHGVERFRILYKRNARGELVVALIIPDDGKGPLSKDNVP